MNKYIGEQLTPETFPLDVKNIDDTIDELATLYSCQELEADDIADDLLELI